MLSQILSPDRAPAHARFGLGAPLLLITVPATPRDRAIATAVALLAAGPAVVSERPPAYSARLCASRAHVAGQAKSALQQPTNQKFAHTMTRNAAIGGGAMGPHLARDPV